MDRAHRLTESHSEPGTDGWVDPVPDGAPGPLDAMVANCAEVTRHLAEVPRHRVISIPEEAVAMVAGLGSYGD